MRTDRAGTPPELDGYDMLEQIGSGGFAEVYLYEQRMPRRRVAVKVLSVPGLDDAGRRRFQAEANVMAQLSSHPAIMTVHTAGIAADGSPYIVMEHCPGGSLGDGFRGRRMPVPEALEIGVTLAGALETAHRIGVLHRDVKPANILLSEYGAPLLTDFGISAAVGLDPISGDESLSVPWSPPEFLDDPPWSGAPSDVYALAATLYSLVAGRAPFETSEGPNHAAAQAARIRAEYAPPLGEPELDDIFAVAMARSPQARYTSALAFARALQGAQRRLGLPETALHIAGGQTRSPAAPVDQTLHRDALTPQTPPADTARIAPVAAPSPTPQPSTPPAAATTEVGVAAPEIPAAAPISELDVFEPSPEVRVAARGALPPPRRRRSGGVGGWILDGALLFAATMIVTMFLRGMT